MTGLTYMQRRKGSGIYEFRKRLPTSLAGKPCPVPLRAALEWLVNPITGSFKKELTKSLETTDQRLAKLDSQASCSKCSTTQQASGGRSSYGQKVRSVPHETVAGSHD